MTFLPVVDRELRVAARRRATYWNRLGIALVGLLIGGWIMLIPFFRSPRHLGMALFVPLAIAAFVYAALAGVLVTADCVSEEKREGTLGLLFLTDLKGYDVVLGKLAATSLNTFYGLLALFPVMAIPLLVGGVSPAEFWRVVLVCVNNLLFSLALGIFSSSVSRDERKAVVLALMLLLVFVVGFPLLAVLVHEWRPLRPIRSAAEYFFIPCPAYGCFVAFDALYASAKPNFFYQSVLCANLVSWVALLAACGIVPRAWQDETQSDAARQRRRLWYRLAHGSAAARRAVRARLLTMNPFYWLTGRDRVKGLLVWALLGTGAFIWMLGLIYNPRDWKDPAAYVVTTLIAHTLLKLWLAGEAGRRLATDRRSGALELLLSTPLKVGQILSGQFLALFKQFGGPVLVVLIADVIFALTNRREEEWIMFWIVITTVFVADLVTLGWVGMWMGLRSRNANRAAAAAIVRVLVLPWAMFGLVMTLLAVTEFANRSLVVKLWGSHVEIGIMGSWLIIALAVDFVFGIDAARRLTRDFRAAAAQRYEGRRKRKG